MADFYRSSGASSTSNLPLSAGGANAAAAGISRQNAASPAPFGSSAASSAFSTLSKRVSTATSTNIGQPTSTVAINIVDRNISKTKGTEVAYAAWAFLFSEIVTYTQKRINSISDFEARLSKIGYRVGSRLIELLPLRDSLPPSTSRGNAGPPRLTRLLPVLQYIHTTLFKYLFGRPASSLERSTEAEDEYMVGDDEPVLDRGIQVPRDMSQLNTNALLAGIVEAAMEGLGFPSRVTAHLVPTEQHPRRTVLLIKLNKDVMEREKALASSSR